MSLWTTTRKTVEEATMTSNLFSSPSLSSEEIHLELMELQEMLIKAGYLNPDETKAGEETWKVYEDSTGALGMDAACEVFYNMVC